MMLDAPPGESARSPGAHTVCESWLVDVSDRRIVAVRCCTPAGELIECCGHGLLAAAHAWHRRLGRDRLTLLMNGSRVESWRHESGTWLRFGGVATEPCAMPAWVGGIFAGRSPEAAAICGGAKGYLVLQWPDDVDLHDLKPDIPRIPGCTGRALVCTAAQPREGEGAVQLRYFAPQYGVAEDDATGSAMRVLAAYWSTRWARLSARQCSRRGGRLLSHWSPGSIDIGGQCREMPLEKSVA